MPSFVLTASHQMDRSGCNFHVAKGDTQIVTINKFGVTESNLFSRSEFKAEIAKALGVPVTDSGILSRGAWDIKLKR